MDNPKLINYGHMHIDAEDEEYGMIMPCVVENGNKHDLIDDWGDLTGEEDKLLGSFDTAFEAVKEGIKMIKIKFPKAQIMYGAGQPPSEWLNKILEVNYNEKGR